MKMMLQMMTSKRLLNQNLSLKVTKTLKNKLKKHRNQLKRILKKHQKQLKKILKKHQQKLHKKSKKMLEYKN